MRQSRGKVYAGLCFALLSSRVCFAEFIGPPAGAAGVVEQEIQREYSVQDLSPQKEIPLLEIDVPQKTLNIPEGLSVTVENIRIEGNESLSVKELNQVLVPYLNREISGVEVKELCLQLQKKYVEKGFILARVYPPVQEVKDHTLIIQVVEGTLGSIEVTGNHYYKAKYIRKYFAHMQGKPINYNTMMRALLLANENADLGVGAIFKKGKEFGQVDLSIVAKDSLPFHIYTDYNTWGSNVTTYGRAGAKITGGNLSTNGDTLGIVGVVGTPPKDLYYINTTYSAPINANGMYFDLSYLYSHFEVQQMTSLDLEGLTQIAGGRIRQALSRTRKFSSDIFVAFDYKQLKNEVLGQTGSFDRLRVLELGGKVDYFDSVKGRNLFNASCSIGIPYFLGGSSPIDSNSSREGAGGRFYILNMEYTRIQTLPADCFIFFSASGQGTFNKIPIPQQIYIGGMGTVRGYPLSVALGDTGYYGTLELHTPLPFVGNKYCDAIKKPWKDIFQLVGFVDHGGVYTNDEVESEVSPTYLTAVGAGIRFYGPWNFNVSFDAGFPLTDQYKLFENILYVKVTLGVL
jgi:hemolysin activation/secretion protein